MSLSLSGLTLLPWETPSYHLYNIEQSGTSWFPGAMKTIGNLVQEGKQTTPELKALECRHPQVRIKHAVASTDCEFGDASHD